MMVPRTTTAPADAATGMTHEGKEDPPEEAGAVLPVSALESLFVAVAVGAVEVTVLELAGVDVLAGVLLLLDDEVVVGSLA